MAVRVAPFLNGLVVDEDRGDVSLDVRNPSQNHLHPWNVNHLDLIEHVFRVGREQPLNSNTILQSNLNDRLRDGHDEGAVGGGVAPHGEDDQVSQRNQHHRNRCAKDQEANVHHKQCLLLAPPIDEVLNDEEHDLYGIADLLHYHLNCFEITAEGVLGSLELDLIKVHIQNNQYRGDWK